MRRRTFTTMLAGLACAVAVSGPLLAQAQSTRGGLPRRGRAMQYCRWRSPAPSPRSPTPGRGF